MEQQALSITRRVRVSRLGDPKPTSHPDPGLLSRKLLTHHVSETHRNKRATFYGRH